MRGVKKIDFFIIGTQKAGTTSLYNYLIQHPDIYFSEVKELRYFIDTEIFSRGEKYLNEFFYKYKGQELIGSSHVHMLPSKDAPERVFNYNPKAKLIIILRDPIKRAVSAFDYAIKNGWEPEAKTLHEAYEMEAGRMNADPVNYDLLYFNNGLYSTHIDNWSRFFPKEQILVLTDAELRNQPQELLNKIFDFLEIKHQAIDFSKEYNVKSRARFPRLQKMLLSRAKYKKQVGKLLPSRLTVWIRSRVFKKLVKLNSVEVKEETQKPVDYVQEYMNEYVSYFKNDMDALNKNFGIDFTKKD